MNNTPTPPPPTPTSDRCGEPGIAATAIDITIEPLDTKGKVKITARAPDGDLYIDIFNIYSERSRSACLNSVCSRWPGVDRQLVKDELDRAAAQFSSTATPTAPTTPAISSAEMLAQTPESVKADACSMLESPDLVETIRRDIEAIGVAGESDLALTLYLIGTSRLLDNPLGAIVQGPTASGKSYPIEKTAALFPPETVIHAKQMTPRPSSTCRRVRLCTATSSRVSGHGWRTMTPLNPHGPCAKCDPAAGSPS